ncbi:hypothetical protein Tco_0490689 [Tanacetum coccineum]
MAKTIKTMTKAQSQDPPKHEGKQTYIKTKQRRQRPETLELKRQKQSTDLMKGVSSMNSLSGEIVSLNFIEVNNGSSMVITVLPMPHKSPYNSWKVVCSYKSRGIWDRVKLLIEGSELSLQERESKLYDKFDTFTSAKGKTIQSYYLRFAQLINDMNTIRMSMKPLQLYAYLRQHEAHANEVRLMRQRFTYPLALVANTYTSPPCYTNHSQGSGGRGNATGTRVNRNVGTNTTGQAKVVRCYNYQAPSASVVLMAKLSAYDSDVLSEYSEQPPFINDSNIDITSGSNVISYDQYLKETENKVVQDTTSIAQQDALIMSVTEEMSNQD